MTLDEFEVLLNEIGVPVSHYQSDREGYPYIVYFEYAEGGLSAENKVVASCDYVQISYFTQTKKDINVKRIKELLNDNEIPYEKTTIFEKGNTGFNENADGELYEVVDKVIHHVFDCVLI